MGTSEEKQKMEPPAPALGRVRSRGKQRRPRRASSGERAQARTDSILHELLQAVIARCTAQRGERKQLRSRRREQEIMRAALRIFARDGISRSRIGDIAAEAGMPISTIYEYFDSKEELAYVVPMAELAAFFHEFAELAQSQRGARARLRSYLWLAADFARRNPEWARVLYLEIWPSVLLTQSPLREIFDDYVRIMLHLLREGETDGEWPKIANHYETAAILNGGLNQIIITALLYRRPRNLSAAAASAVDRALTLLDRGPQLPRQLSRRRS